MKSNLRFLTGLSLTLSLGLATGCPGDKDDGTTGANESSTGASESSTGPGMTGMQTTMVADSGDSGPMTSSSSTAAATEDTGPVCAMDGELGATCTDPMCDCMSGNCFVVGPLGGVCSECDEDADCPDPNSGCNFGNPLTGMAATCSDGSIGSGCETADACADGLFCPVLINVPGIIMASTCSECESDADCPGQECAPTYDIANIAGYYQCVDAGSIPNDEGCDLMGDGSECMSGQCAPAAIMMLPVVGVCSPCNEDADCMPGETCTLPEVAIEGTSLALVPGFCG